jgi:hypothetical protein
MTLKVIQGSATTKRRLSPEEYAKRLQEFKVIHQSPEEAYQLAWVAIESDTEVGSLIFRYKFGYMELGALVTIRVVLDDAQSGADLAITNRTTLPGVARGQGYGTQALRMLLGVAKKKGLQHIQAVQVQKESEHFWIKNGFVALNTITNDFRYGQP